MRSLFYMKNPCFSAGILYFYLFITGETTGLPSRSTSGVSPPE